MMHGYTGAQPKPIMTKPINARTAWNGRMTSRIPIPMIPKPNRTKKRSLNFIARNPLIPRPTVMPM